MPKVEVHTDDLPRWAVRKEKVPHSLLGYLREPRPSVPRWEDGFDRRHHDATAFRGDVDGQRQGSGLAAPQIPRKINPHSKRAPSTLE